MHAVALHPRVRVHGGCVQKGCALDSGFGGHTKLVLVLEGVRAHADLEQAPKMHSSKSFLTPQCDFLQQEAVRHDAKHDQHPQGTRQEVVPARCVESHCGESGALEGLSRGDSDPRRVKYRRGQPSLCLWVRVQVLGSGAVPAQRAGCHCEKSLLCKWATGLALGSVAVLAQESVLGPGAVLAQRAGCHCGETLWWEVARGSKGDPRRCLLLGSIDTLRTAGNLDRARRRGSSAGVDVLPGGSVVKWVPGVLRQAERQRVWCVGRSGQQAAWVVELVLGSVAVLEQGVQCHCEGTCRWGVPRRREGDSRSVQCHRGQPLLYLGVTRQLLRPAAAFAQSVTRQCGQSLGAVRQEHAAMSKLNAWAKAAHQRMEEQRKSEMPGMLVAKQKATQNARDGTADRAAQNKEARQLREAEEVRIVQESLQMLSMDLQWSAAAQAWGADGALLEKISACARQMGVGFKRDDTQGVVLMVAAALTAGKGLRAAAMRALETNTGPTYALLLEPVANVDVTTE